MSAKSKGTSSPTEGQASKAKVKEQIKIIVDDLELVLGDLKDVAKELKEVVDQIDTLTSDLQLEDEMTDSSKTDTLNSSSSSTTASSLDKVKVRANAPLISPPAHPSAVLTVLRKPNPPPPPPRLTPVKFEETQRLINSANSGKNNGVLLRNGGLPGGPVKLPNGDRCTIHNIKMDKSTGQLMTQRPEKDHASTRERVRFSENVLYHGYCPDCDVRSEMKNRDVHHHGESVHLARKFPHHCSLSPPQVPPFPVENGGLGISNSGCHPPLKPGNQPPPTTPKPQKTILRKSTTTTV
ncbi:protein Largen isoform X1 [Hyla sarda]|uniref:protein Largen isoform X1 n=2 Tax=Hyla sarda TaxID=327740 RepID=UPI0024C46C5E|nr:protein Largen isoform X1 [Hyla sarda]XP_056393334.1 protein Largen isoform X1 [Hyla sarda]